MIDKLLLMSNKPLIPFIQAQLFIHNPTLVEIGMVGQETFLSGCSLLTFSKNFLFNQDKSNLEEYTDFEVLMTIMNKQDKSIRQAQLCVYIVLSLLFTDYKIGFSSDSIVLSKDEQRFQINKSNYQSFRNIVSQMFCLDEIRGRNTDYNPGGPQAAALVKKFKARQKKLAQMKNKNNEPISLLYTYVSVLSVGLQKDKNELMQYTIFQLFDEYRRFNAKEEWDAWFSAKLAGAKDIKDIDNWRGSLSSQNNS